jgi:hypothetical protein
MYRSLKHTDRLLDLFYDIIAMLIKNIIELRDHADQGFSNSSKPAFSYAFRLWFGLARKYIAVVANEECPNCCCK